MKYREKIIIAVLSALLPLSIETSGQTSECANYKAQHPEWIFCDDFENSTVNDYDGGWKDYVTYVDKSQDPAGVYSGRKALLATITPGVNSAASLYKYLPGQDSSVFVRWYAKFDTGYNDQGGQHFVTLQGLDASLPCGCPGCCANTRPLGNDRFLSALEYTDLGDSLESRFYSYFYNQRNQSTAYRCCPKPLSSWAQSYEPAAPFKIAKGVWHLMEFMIHPNTPGKDDGYQKYWIDNVLVLDEQHASGPCGPYTTSTTNECEQDSASVDVHPNYYTNPPPYSTVYPAEGFVWRTSSSLKINNVWIQLFNHNWATNPRPNKVWFDNVVVSTKYIGPLASSPVAGSSRLGRAGSKQLRARRAGNDVCFSPQDPARGLAIVKVFDLAGRAIAEVRSTAPGGSARLVWNTRSAAAGIYVCSASPGDGGASAGGMTVIDR